MGFVIVFHVPLFIYFFGSEVWDQCNHKLVIQQALLGPEAAEGKVNVVQAEAITFKGALKIPVAVLKAGRKKTFYKFIFELHLLVVA